nr:GHKL domain-containing protein [Clostridia bacterium]
MNWSVFENRVTDFVIMLILMISLTMAYKPRLKRPGSILAILGMTALGSVLIVLQEQISFGIFWLYVLMFIFTGGLYAKFFLHGQFWPKMAMVCVYCCAYFLLNRVVRNTAMLLNGGRSMIGLRYMGQPLVLLSGWFLYKNAIRTKHPVPIRYPLCISIVSLLFLAVLSYNSALRYACQADKNAALLRLLIECAVMLATLFTTFWLSNSLILRHDTTRLQVSMSTRKQSEKQMAQESERLRRQMSLIRHEVSNQLSTLAALLDQGETQRARALLDEVCASLPAPSDEIRSGNTVSDAVLNQKIAQARAQGIAVTHDVCMNGPLAIRDSDLSALLSNLLNNALEASAQINDPAIGIHIYPAKGYLCISIRNRADVDALRKNPLLQTTKEHPEAHGLGLEVVREIAERYHGMVDFSTEESFFVARIMLMMG